MGKGWGWAHPERTQGWPSIVANDTLWTSAPCPRSTTGSGAGCPMTSRAPAPTTVDAVKNGVVTGFFPADGL